MSTLSILDGRIRAAGIPIEGVADNGDGTYRVDFTAGATPAQKSAAAGIVSAFNPQDALDKQAEIDQAQPVAKTWFSGQAAAIAFIKQTPEAQATQIDGYTLAQLRTVVKYLAIAVSMLIKERLLP